VKAACGSILLDSRFVCGDVVSNGVSPCGNVNARLLHRVGITVRSEFLYREVTLS
jgi:hypothetical protein